MLQVILLRRPGLGAADLFDAYEIASAGFVGIYDEEQALHSKRWVDVDFDDWFGEGGKEKRGGTVTASDKLLTYLMDTVWWSALLFEVVVILVVVIFLLWLCGLVWIVGWNMDEYEYRKAQYGKKWGTRDDVEKVVGGLSSTEESGSQTGGRPVGVVKKD
jgi:hypothetical protein